MFAENKQIKDELSKYEGLKDNIVSRNEIDTCDAIMFFDYPADKETFEEIIKSSNPKALHFMEYDIKYFDDKEFLKIITGMIKFACNNNGGKIDLIRCAGFLGKSVKLITLFLDLADECDIINIEEKNNLYYTVKMISMDNIGSILHNPKYMEILNLAEECELYQKSLLEDDITDIDSMCNMIL